MPFPLVIRVWGNPFLNRVPQVRILPGHPELVERVAAYTRYASTCVSVVVCGFGERHDRVFPNRHLDGGFVTGSVVADAQVESVIELAFEALGELGHVGLQLRDLISLFEFRCWSTPDSARVERY